MLECIMPNGQEPEVSEPLEDGEWLSVCPELRCRGEGNTILNAMTDLIPDGVVARAAEELERRIPVCTKTPILLPTRK